MDRLDRPILFVPKGVDEKDEDSAEDSPDEKAATVPEVAPDSESSSRSAEEAVLEDDRDDEGGKAPR